MESLKKYFISGIITIVLIVISSFFINVLNYFDILNSTFYKGLLLLFLIISISSGSYFLGINSNNRGYLKGGIFGIIIVILFIITSLLFGENLSNSSIIYYLVLIITSSIAGAIGINRKNSTTN